MPRSRYLIAGLALCALCLDAAFAAAPAGSAAAGVPAGSILQVVAGLAAVLALVGAAAWLLKRFSGIRAGGSGLIRVIGGAALGQRERIVLVEVGATWLLVGVAPGQVRTLHTMPRTESAIEPGAPTPAAAASDTVFSTWLRRMMEKRSHD